METTRLTLRQLARAQIEDARRGWMALRSTRAVRVQTAFTLAIAAMIFALFHFHGNTYSGLDVREATRSLFVWLVRRWKDSSMSFGGGDYSHGWLVPVVSLWAVWFKRREWLAAPKRTSRAGLGIVVAALLLHWAGARAELPQVSAVALVLLLWGIPFYVAGWAAARVLLFPCFYLMLCIPWSFFDNLTFPLRLFTTSVTTFLLNGLGIAAERAGTAIYSAAGGGFNFDVADPCSGIRSLMALLALAGVYAFATQKTHVKQWLIFLSAVPLAIAGNTARVLAVGIVAAAFGAKAATGLYHDYSGYVFYTVAVLLMVALDRVINRRRAKPSAPLRVDAAGGPGGPSP